MAAAFAHLRHYVKIDSGLSSHMTGRRINRVQPMSISMIVCIIHIIYSTFYMHELNKYFVYVLY